MYFFLSKIRNLIPVKKDYRHWNALLRRYITSEKRTRTCAYYGVRNVCFSENMAFWDSCHITDDYSSVLFFCYVTKYLNTQHILFLKSEKKQKRFLYLRFIFSTLDLFVTHILKQKWRLKRVKSCQKLPHCASSFYGFLETFT